MTEMKNWAISKMSHSELPLPLCPAMAICRAGCKTKSDNQEMSRRVRREVLFQVVGVYENSARIGRIMINVPKAPPRAVACRAIADDD